jgi:Flp pilus assembly protein TadB
VEEITQEEMAAHSPDGRVPDPQSRGRGRKTFWIILGLGLPVVLGMVIYFGGIPALLMGLVYVAVFAAVAFPVWYAGLMRRQEVAESNQMVKDTLGEESDRSRAA